MKKLKVEQPHLGDPTIEEEVKETLLQQFNNISPKGGRQLLMDSGVLILLEWGIANAIIFDTVRREKETKY